MIRERTEMSYQTRRSPDPVSSKPSSDLDSGQSLRDFRNDRCGARTTNIEFYSTLLGIIALDMLNGEGTDKLKKLPSRLPSLLSCP